MGHWDYIENIREGRPMSVMARVNIVLMAYALPIWKGNAVAVEGIMLGEGNSVRSTIDERRGQTCIVDEHFPVGCVT